MHEMENLKYGYTSLPLHVFLALRGTTSPPLFTLRIQANTTKRYSHCLKIATGSEIWHLRDDEYHFGLWRTVEWQIGTNVSDEPSA